MASEISDVVERYTRAVESAVRAHSKRVIQGAGQASEANSSTDANNANNVSADEIELERVKNNLALELSKSVKEFSSSHRLRDADCALLSTTLHPEQHLGIGLFITTLHNEQLLAWLSSEQAAQSNTHDNMHRITNQYHQSTFYAQRTPTSHLRVWNERATVLAEQIFALGGVLGNVKGTLHPLRALLTALTGGALNELTPIHHIFTKACIEANLAAYALPLLERGVDELATQYTQLNAKDNLFYLVNAGILWCMLERYNEALEVFEMSLTLPVSSNTVPAAMLHSYKCYLLLQLLTTGAIRPLPKYASTALDKSLKKHSPVYHSLLEVSSSAKEKDGERERETGSRSSFESTGETMQLYVEILCKHRHAIEADGLLKLGALAEDALYAAQINNFAQVYTAISILELCKEMGVVSMDEDQLSQFTQRLMRYIQAGQVHATIDAVNQVVHFNGQPEIDESAMAERLEHAVKMSLHSRQQVVALDRHIALNPTFVKHHVGKTERRRREKEREEDDEERLDKGDKEDEGSDEMELSDGDRD